MLMLSMHYAAAGCRLFSAFLVIVYHVVKTFL